MTIVKSIQSLGAVLAFGLAVAASPARAADMPYHVLQPAQPVETGHKIEVLEVFSYACPHCNALEPGLEQWARTLPKDVELRHLPATLRADWEPFSRIYYAEEAMGVTGKLHARVYQAVHRDHLNLGDDKVLSAWVGRQGINSQQFMNNVHSFSVVTKSRQAMDRIKAFGVTGVPTLIIDGKYRTSVADTGSEQQLFRVADQLISKARLERGARH